VLSPGWYRWHAAASGTEKDKEKRENRRWVKYETAETAEAGDESRENSLWNESSIIPL